MTEPKMHPELHAVQTLHQVLMPLDPEVRARVVRAVCSLIEISGITSKSLNNEEKEDSENKQPKRLANDIASFVSSKRPSDTYQKMACLAYWLEHQDNKVDMSAKDLDKANTDARQTKISNATTFLNLATRRHGLFTASGHGKKRLSSRGEAVVLALPDQGAVKTALQQHPLPKAGGRRSKKKKVAKA